MGDITDEEIERVFDSMADTFNLLMGAKTGQLQTPTTVTVELDGPQARAMGSARHIVEEVQDAGYSATQRLVEELEPVESLSDESRYKFEISVSGEE